MLALSLEKSFPGFRLAVALEVQEGEVLALLGPSGSGKSTLLRLIAGLLPPDKGFVRFRDQDLTPLPPERRGVGFLFQDYALFPHLTVAENLAFGLVEARWPKAAREARVEELLRRMELTPHARKRPQELSGGEQQRVALARALAPRPRLLLLDEPLGALDLRLREELLLFLRRTLRAEGITTLVVTHDQEEAFLLAGRVAVMREGRLVQVGRPEEVYTRPQDAWTARFLGHKNLLSPEESQALGLPPKPHLLPPQALGLGGPLRGKVEERLFFGARVGLWVRAKGVRLYLEAPAGPEEGTEVGLHLDPKRAVAFGG
ncbi:MAG: ABC transporter ATP-binding protein [Thermus sp.]|uniref:ABC transporter ATP-binding protein n=1 Tax=Thermus sp. TaxID=275 RepID=UPI0025D5196E|nr:ABC transporter ATP-binding protein [Thermus sp.]MCS7217958.1 ABC transporter ATP-binding protein [Thermus sp.]MDW8357031.1 ABC transporter ATP-binding protein [Thermus sp.]